MVTLDIRILVLFCALAGLIQGGLSLLFSSQDSNTRALRPIGFSSMTMALAFIGMAAQGTVPDVFSLVVAPSLQGVTLLLLDRGVRVFQREPLRDALGWGVVGFTTLGLGLINSLTDDLRPRIILLSIAGFWLHARLALRLRRGARSSGTRAHRITESIFWIFAGVMLLRIVAAAVGPYRSTETSPDLIQAASLAISILLFSAATLGFWSMEVQRLHGELLKLASTDELTGTLNRRAFLAQCERHLARRARTGEPLSLVLFDLDHFKRVNDTYGHPVGDEVLRHAVQIVALSVRPGDALGRFGGEEFAMMLPATDANQALFVAERARLALASAPYLDGDLRIPITCSVGVASFPLHGGNLEALIYGADDALYAAKADGRNCACVAEAPV